MEELPFLVLAREMRMLTARALVWDVNISTRALHTSTEVFSMATPSRASRVREESK
jgi:hypothetical protein